MEKRGLSNIIVTLLIIVLSLVAISLVWGVVKNVLESDIERIGFGQFTLDLVIKSVKVEGEDLSIGVKRNVGKGNFTGLKFVFENYKESEIIEKEVTLKELEEKKFTFSLGELSILGINKISIAPTYKLISGKELIGRLYKFDLKKAIRGEEGSTWNYISAFEKYGPVDAGRTGYSISSDVEEIIKITNVIIDPLDVKLGDNQTFIAYVSSPNEIIEVITRTQLDNEILILPLKKTENENEYMATWVVYDTHTEIYRTNFTARDSEGNENTVYMSWTDPCTSLANHGTTTTISSPCSVSLVDGIDEGKIIVGSGGSITLNSGGVFVFTPGYSVSFTGGGKLIKADGGVLKKAYLYYNDADGDSYGNGYDWSTGSTFAGHVRANSALGDSDCLDSDADVYRNVGSLILDNDQDRYSTGSSATRCVGGIQSTYWYKDADASYKWISTSSHLGTDCNDGSSSAWRNRYDDTDGDGYCQSSTLYCVGNHAGYTNSCTSFSDCNDGSSSVQVNLYDDTDNDGYCQSSTLYCVANGAAGYRSSCTSFSDCLDSDADVYRNVGSLILDSDQDRYSTGSSATRCVGSKSSYWYKHTDGIFKWISTSSDLGTDCNDGSSSVWRNRYDDTDGDGYCQSSTLYCVGNHAGYTNSCTSFSDCNDGSSSVWQSLTGYVDSDGDTYTTGGAQSICSGSSLPSGYRSSANGDDCLDSDADVYRNVGSLGLDSDQDRYSNGGTATRCVGSKSSYWYKATSGAYVWISTSDDLGTTDCNTALSSAWRNRYDDTDNDGYCSSSTLYCVGNHAGYRDSCTLFSDCFDTDADIYRNVGSLGLDVDHDRYTIGSSKTRCVGSKSSYWYKDIDGTFKWITTADDLGTDIDCNDNDNTVFEDSWGSGVASGPTCNQALGTDALSGACSPVLSTRDYTQGFIGMTCQGGTMPRWNMYTQTCEEC